MSIYEASPEAPAENPAPAAYTGAASGGSELSDPKLGQQTSPLTQVSACCQSIYTAIANFLGEALPGFSSVEAYTKNKKSWCLTAVVVLMIVTIWQLQPIEDEIKKLERDVENYGSTDPHIDRFKLVDKALTWNNAKAYCRTHYRDLASIHSADENLQVHKHCEKAGKVNCWIGLHQPAHASLLDANGQMKPILAFDNRGKCNVDHRIAADLFDIPISQFQVSRVDGTKQTFSAKRPGEEAPTLRKILLRPWTQVEGSFDLYKIVASDTSGDKTKALYIFSDDDIITDGMFDDSPVCPQAVLAHTDDGRYTQDTCTGTPNGLFSMAPPNAKGIFDQLMADSGECKYNQNWGWVINAMWITPDRTANIANSATWKEMYKWSDGSSIDYNNWGDAQPNTGSQVQYSPQGHWESADGAKTKQIRNPDKKGKLQFNPSDKPGQYFVCEVKGPRYSLVDQSMTWTSARAYCREFYTDLASIHNDQDQHDAHNACKMRSGGSPCYDSFTNKQQCAGTEGCWIGLTSGTETKSLNWTDGTPLDYHKWYPGQPKVNPNENEVLLRMACDPEYCPKGQWKLHNGRKRGVFGTDPLIANEAPFLCEGPPRNSGGPSHAIESACVSSAPSPPNGGNGAYNGPNGR